MWLYSRVGRDSDGDAVVGAIAALGVGTDGIGRSDRRPTASYTALLDGDGELVIALADMGIYEELNARGPGRRAGCRRGLHDLVSRCQPADPPVLAFLAEAAPANAFVALDTVSVAKAYRVLGILDRVDYTSCSPMPTRPPPWPAATCATHWTPARQAAVLRERGAKRVVMGRGADGVCVAEASADYFLPAVSARVADVDGRRGRNWSPAPFPDWSRACR